MREVAKGAKTTTPTLYERFKDRDALIEAMTDVHRDRLFAVISTDDSMELVGSKVLAYCRKNPNAVDLLLKRIATNVKSKKHGPIAELVRRNLIERDGLSEKDADEITLASSSMIYGTAMLCSNIGSGSPAVNLERTTLKAMRKLVSAYQD